MSVQDRVGQCSDPCSDLRPILCPISVSVTCTSDMTYICYGPVQEGVDFSAGSKMYTDGHEADVSTLTFTSVPDPGATTATPMAQGF